MSERRTVLVIDDDQDILELAKMTLEANGFTVATASRGSEGIEAAQRICPDLILCDMIMESDGEGLKVCRHMREAGCKVPVVLVSNVGSAALDNFDIYAEGFTGVIQKPFSAQTLLDVVNSALAKR